MKKYVLTVIGVLTVYVAAATIYIYRPGDEFKDAPEVIEGCNDSAISGIVYSLKNYPNKWSTNEFELEHRNGITVWIANKDYGLEIGFDGETYEYTMSDQCRSVLYSATQNWNKDRITDIIRK